MSVHYNAFISYRHAELDTRVAAEVQKQLERFRIPGAIRKQTGMRRIDRIFRDKEELSLTSDLNETIETALEHADFLIVICSYATRESVWVQREIEFFLKTHDRRKVLTVVAEGEPAEVVPEILQYEQMELTAEDGSVQKVRVPMEPLSCDYRMAFAKACREELPRLAAALLGCSYDDLRRRQRQYRMTRLAVASAAVMVGLAGLSCYYVWSAAQIRENYEQALCNQSDYLASESQKILEEGDRLTAMLLAIHALPSEQTPRPVMPGAVKALVDASYAYKAPGSDDLTLDKSFTHPEDMKGYIADWERQRLITYGYYKLFVWDMQTGKELFSQAFSDSIFGVWLMPDGNLMVSTATQMFCMDSETFGVLWRMNWNPTQAAFRSDGGIVFAQEGSLYLADGVSGEILQSANSLEILQVERCSFIEIMAVSSDDRYAAVAIRISAKEGVAAMIWDLETNTMVCHDVRFDSINSMVFLPDGGLTVSGWPKDYSPSLTWGDRGVDYHILYPGIEQLLCMEPDGSTRWMTQTNYSQQYYGQQLLQCDYMGQPAVICAVGNVAEVLNRADGTVLVRYEMPAPVVGVYADDAYLYCILQNGQLAGVCYEEGVLRTQAAFVTELVDGRLEGEVLVQPEKTDRVLLYRGGVYDESWQEVIQNDEQLWDVSDERQCMTRNGLVLLEGSTFSCYSADSGQLLWEVTPEQEDDSWTILGCSADGSAIVASEKYGTSVIWISADTGAVTQLELSYEPSRANYDGNSVYYYSNMLPGVVIADRCGERLLQAEELKGFFPQDILPNRNGTQFLLRNYEGECKLLSKHGVKELPDVIEDKMILRQPDGSGFVTANDRDIHLRDQQLQSLVQIYNGGRTVQAMHIHDGQLLVVYNTNKLYRYDADTGEYLGSTELAGSNSSRVAWDFSQPGQLALLLGTDLHLIDLDSWQVYTVVEDCFGYMAEENMTFVRGYAGEDSYSLGIFKICGYEELTRRAEAVLGELELTSEQKARYGIE